MRDIRLGEELWMSWDGDNSYYLSEDSDQEVYYTIGHVDLENDLVRRALASTIQRDGIADSLAQGFKCLESCTVIVGHAGVIDGDIFLSTCDEQGVTEYGDNVEAILQITWVQFDPVF